MHCYIRYTGLSHSYDGEFRRQNNDAYEFGKAAHVIHVADKKVYNLLNLESPISYLGRVFGSSSEKKLTQIYRWYRTLIKNGEF